MIILPWFVWFAGMVLLAAIAQLDKVKITKWIRFLIIIWPLSATCYVAWNLGIIVLNRFRYFLGLEQLNG